MMILKKYRSSFLKVNKNDYTADFKVGSKNFHDIISQLLSFGNQIKFICNLWTFY